MKKLTNRLARVASFTTAALLAALTLMAAPAPARALDVRLEVAPLVHFSLSPLLDGLPLEVPNGPLTGAREIFLVDLSHKPGFGASFALLLGNWEIRYEFAAVEYDKLTVEHVQFPDYTGVLSLDASELSGRSADISGELDPIFFHYAGFGYRFTPWDWVVHPYFPISLGFAAAQIRNGGETLLGFTVQLGAGVEWDPLEQLRVGLSLRYNFSAFKLPDTTFSSIKSVGIQAAATNSSLTEAVMETLSTLSLNLHISYKF